MLATSQWAEATDASATIQDTEARVFVGGPIDSVAEVAFHEGRTTPTAAFSTIYIGFDASKFDRNLLVLNDATAFLNRGAVCINGTDWFTYSVKAGNSLQIEQHISGSGAPGFAPGATVTQWQDITHLVHDKSLAGRSTDIEGTWELTLSGQNWNSQLIFDGATFLLQERQWDNGKGDLPPLDADWTSWRDKYVGYGDTPTAERDSEGNLVWTVRVKGRNKYLRTQKVAAGTYGLRPLAAVHTASSDLKNPLLEPNEGVIGGNDFTPARAGDGNALTLWISSEIPTSNKKFDHPIGGNFYRFANGVKQYNAHIQQIFCNGRATNKWSRQQLTWIEIWNPHIPDDGPDPNVPTNQMNGNYWILENSRGQRIYLGASHGSVAKDVTIPGFNSGIFCWSAQAFNEGWKSAPGALVWPYAECDGYIPAWDDWTPAGPGPNWMKNSGALMHGAGLYFDLNPEGDWLALRRRPSIRDSDLIMMGVTSPLDTANFGKFVENVIDFVAWGDPAKMGPHPTLGAGFPSSGRGDPTGGHGIPAHFFHMVIGPGQGTFKPDGTPDPQPGDYAYSEDIYPQDGYWGAYNQGTGDFSETPKLPIPLPIDSDGVPRIPAGTALIRKNAMAGGVGWPQEADGTPILGGDPTARFDSQSPDDWEIVGNPKTGNSKAIDGPVTHTLELTPFVAPIVVADTGDTIVLISAVDFPQPAPGATQAVTSDQPGVLSGGFGSAITFTYTSRDNTTLYGVANRVPDLNSPSVSANRLRAGAALTLLINAANPGAPPLMIAANLPQIAVLQYLRYHRTGGVPSVPKDFYIRISRLPTPNDPKTYIKGDDWTQNPDWENVYSAQGNTTPNILIKLNNSFARWVAVVINEMSDLSRVKANEIVAWGPPSFVNFNPAESDKYLTSLTTGDVVRYLLEQAGVPPAQIRIEAGIHIRSIDVAAGDVWSACTSICRRSGAVLVEDRLGNITMRHHPSYPNLPVGLPALVVTPAVARDRVKETMLALDQVGQIELLARDDFDGLEWTVHYPPVRDLYGQVKRIDGMFAGSETEAIELAQFEYRKSNGGTEVVLDVGQFDEVGLFGIIRAENLITDTSGQEIVGRDYVCTAVQETQAGGDGKSVILTGRERVVW